MPFAPSRWDPLVRTTHWFIALAVLFNAVVTEEGSQAHVWVGYVLGAILALRLVWGRIGSEKARFTAFPPSPARALEHIRDIRAGKARVHRSHNPLGALMVYAIWTCLVAVIATGVAMAGLAGSGRGAGEPRPGYAAPPSPSDELNEEGMQEDTGHEAGERDEGLLKETHETAVHLLYLLILLHVAGVAFEVRRSGRHVVLAMLPGRR